MLGINFVCSVKNEITFTDTPNGQSIYSPISTKMLYIGYILADSIIIRVISEVIQHIYIYIMHLLCINKLD
jgi:hypothetical protein